MKLKASILILFCLLVIASSANLIVAQSSATLSGQAQTAYNAKEYEKSARLYAESVQAGDQNAVTFYNAACSFALAGKKEEAFRFLEQSIARGYANVEHIKKDADLISLHSDSRWQQLINKAEAKSNEQKNAFWNQKTFWDNPVLNTPYKDNLSEDEKIIGLSKFWSEVKYNFSNFDLIPDVNWDATYAEFLPRVKNTKSTLEYYRVLKQMCARLKDGHTDIYIPKELRDEIYARPPINTRLVENEVLIIEVYDPALKQNGIDIGQEIIEIDGVPVRQYAEERIAPYQNSSSKQDHETDLYEYQLLIGSSKKTIALTLKDARGNIVKKTLPRLTGEERGKLVKAPNAFEFKMLPGNVAYVALNTFITDRAAQMFKESFEEIAKSNALIIDVRENGGGNSGVGWFILSTLTDKSFKTWGGYMRQYRPYLRAQEQPQDMFGMEIGGEISPNGKNLYTKPVIVLTSPRTYSAAEDFTVAYRQMKRGLIVGEPTGGSTGQPLHFALPGGGAARVVTMRLKFTDGNEFIGRGVQPDKFVVPTASGIYAGRDTVLEAALRELK